ncbi:MAG: hypothetical protein PHC70_04555 [Patescibacteria group bacterium]|nr:hypothetical protein [Patescibacteria group bacterium]
MAADAPKPVRVKPKLGLNALSVALIIIGGVILILLVSALAVAKLGLVPIPILSRFYDGPVPVRLVQTEPLDWDDFRVGLASDIYEQRERQKEGYAVQLSEQELSGLIKSEAEKGLRGQAWKIDLIQVAVTPDYMELYSKLDRSGLGNLDMLIRFRPVVDSKGNIRFEIIETRVGDFKLPVSWGRALASNVFSRDLGSWEITIGGENVIQSISLLDKGLNIILSK